MRGRRLADGDILVRGAAREQVFTDIHAGVGWPDEQPGAIVAVGRRLDGRYHVLEEKRGAMFEIVDAANELASRLPVEIFHVDGSDRLASDFFRRETASIHKSAALPEQPVIAAISDKLPRHFVSALEQVRGLILTARALINERLCPSLMYALRQDFDFAVASPVVRAMVFGLAPLMSYGETMPVVGRLEKRWYRNRWR